MNEVFAFLPGSTIVHKIALVSKRFREYLTELGHFNDQRTIIYKVKA